LFPVVVQVGAGLGLKLVQKALKEVSVFLVVWLLFESEDFDCVQIDLEFLREVSAEFSCGGVLFDLFYSVVFLLFFLILQTLPRKGPS
jgi:hypothetical protein